MTPVGAGASGEACRRRLCELGDHVRDVVVARRDRGGTGSMSDVVGGVAADVLYGVDVIADEAVLGWFDAHWPADEPIRLVMEGIDDDERVTFPAAVADGDLAWTCLVDPVDGTRGLMFDKRPAWVLAGAARGGGPTLDLADIEVAAMTEIPLVKQWRADQLSAVRNGGVHHEGVDGRDGSRAQLFARPSTATDLRHRFASFSHALPEAKGLLASIAEDVWTALVPDDGRGRSVFDDQYLCSGGQVHELLTGRDVVVGDLRPLAHAALGLAGGVAHPYDLATSMLVTEAGGVVGDPWGRPLRSPLDTTTPVAWLGCANPTLAALVLPALADALARHLPTPAAHPPTRNSRP